MDVYQAVPLIVALAVLALWIFALNDLVKRSDSEFPPGGHSANPRLFWAFVVVFFSGLGSLAYYLLVMRPYPRNRR